MHKFYIGTQMQPGRCASFLILSLQPGNMTLFGFMAIPKPDSFSLSMYTCT